VEDRQQEICGALAQALLDMQGWGEMLRFGPVDTAYPERAMLLEELGRRCRRMVTFDHKRTIVARNVPGSVEEYQKVVQRHSSMKRIRSYERKMQREGDSVIRHFRAPEDRITRQRRWFRSVRCTGSAFKSVWTITTPEC
jgi:hypothetical protein